MISPLTDPHGEGALLAVALAKAGIRVKAKGKQKHASGDLFRKGRVESADTGDNRLTASGVVRALLTMGCGIFCCSKQFASDWIGLFFGIG